MTRPLRARHRLIIATLAIVVGLLAVLVLASRRPAPRVDRLTIEVGPGEVSGAAPGRETGPVGPAPVSPVGSSSGGDGL